MAATIGFNFDYPDSPQNTLEEPLFDHCDYTRRMGQLRRRPLHALGCNK